MNIEGAFLYIKPLIKCAMLKVFISPIKIRALDLFFMTNYRSIFIYQKRYIFQIVAALVKSQAYSQV